MPNDYYDTLDIDGDERPIADATARLSLEGKMNKVNPTGSGALSINREDNTTVGDYSAAEGYACEASGEASHGEGSLTKAQGDGAHSEGVLSQAKGDGSHAEGYASTAFVNYSHAEGKETQANGLAAHSEGWNTRANDEFAHAEGESSVASGEASHAEGLHGIASGDDAHAEGWFTEASGAHSHAEGSSSVASGLSSHAEGDGTLASSEAQHVSGKYNIEDNQDTFAEIIGNGTGNNSRSNARTLDWQGNERLAGGLTINAGTASETNIGTALGDKVDKVQGKGLSTEDYTTAEKAKLAGLPSTIPSDADDISYDPTTSGMASTNVQDALDELASEKADTATLSPVATSGRASDVDYTNAGTSINANKVQGAITELDGKYQDLGTNKQDKLTAGNNIQILGSTISATDTTPTNYTTGDTPAAVSVPHGTGYTNLSSVNITAGTWLVNWGIHFASAGSGGNTGHRGGGVSDSSGTSEPVISMSESVPAVSQNNYTRLSGMGIIVATGNKTLYLNARHTQGTGTTLDVQGRLRVIKIL